MHSLRSDVRHIPLACGARCSTQLQRSYQSKDEWMAGNTIGSLVGAAEAGDEQARTRLFEILYTELHRLARREIMRFGGNETLGATTLLHEAYLDLSRGQAIDFPDQARFMAYAARAMRGLAIDYVRKRQALKRGSQFELTPLDTFIAEHHAAPLADPHSAERLEALSAALDRLAEVDSPLAELVDLKFFGGLNFVEIAKLRSVSERTVQRDWAKARALLHSELGETTHR
jgi:RNA polymerase sigma factor (TIGR02999 family)